MESRVTITLKRPITVEFYRAFLSKEQLENKVQGFVSKGFVPERLSERLLNSLLDVSDSEQWVNCPELSDNSLIQSGLTLFTNSSSELAHRNFLLNLFGDIAYQDFARLIDETLIIKSAVLTDFVFENQQYVAVFKIELDVLPSVESVKSIGGLLDNQIEDGWGKNSFESEFNVDLRDMPTELAHDVFRKYHDILLSDYEPIPSVTSNSSNGMGYYNENDELLINHNQLVKTAMHANTIKVSASIHSSREEV